MPNIAARRSVENPRGARSRARNPVPIEGFCTGCVLPPPTPPSMAPRSSLVAAALCLAACGADTETEAEPTPAPAAPVAETMATVEITAPADGSTVDGPSVTVRLDASGVRIVQAGDTTSGTGHHHLYLDDDLTPAGQPVPTVPGRIIHMGDGSAEYVFDDVAPGEHRLIAVVADGVHVPLQPWVVDTVTFTVRE